MAILSGGLTLDQIMANNPAAADSGVLSGFGRIPTSSPSTPTSGFGPAGDYGLKTIDPNWAERNPDKAAAQTSYDQWKYQQQFFRPIEDQVLRNVSGDDADMWTEIEADQAGGMMNREHQNMLKAMMRDRRRQGSTFMDPRQQRSFIRSNELARTKDVAFAENSTRQSQRDFRNEIASQMAGIGRNISQSSSEAFGTASASKAQRDAANAAAKQADKQNKLSAVTTIGGAIIGALIP